MSPHLPSPHVAERLAARPRRRLAAVADLPGVDERPAIADREPDRDGPDAEDAARRAALADHPCAGVGDRRRRGRRHLTVVRDEAGSLVAEYGLLMVLGATITMLATKWATGGAIWTLFGSVLSRARALVGA